MNREPRCSPFCAHNPASAHAGGNRSMESLAALPDSTNGKDILIRLGKRYPEAITDLLQLSELLKQTGPSPVSAKQLQQPIEQVTKPMLPNAWFFIPKVQSVAPAGKFDLAVLESAVVLVSSKGLETQVICTAGPAVRTLLMCRFPRKKWGTSICFTRLISTPR